MSTYQAYEVTGSRQFARTTRELVPPRPGHVRITVESCGVCHSDVLAVEGLRADPSQPVVPGHEVVGTIDAVGEGVRAWQVGERVGVGFLAGHCGECDPCRRGDFVNCADQEQTGTTVDGGYAEVLYARSNALARIPEGISSAEAAPLLCAGLTSLSALRQLDNRPGSLVAVQGIGGLGHLAVQYAARLGHRVVAIARGPEKASLAASLGADDYIDSAAEHPGEALARLGGADGIVATAASGSSMTPLVTGLAPRGRMIVVGVGTDPITVSTPDLVLSTRTITGSLTGTPIENEDNLAFSVRHGVLPLIERMPLAEAPKAYERMMSGEARFRVVLDAVRA
ncbi:MULTISPECIES: alcohol dehydrogenase catalytic domain-containing protein [unclassified Streptomyces]|uniref:alcohol dehydrogenase catalytic domain-containing protein n=1 Tax=unclassified Streptomyces TaxID=2593676 RepID=UPI0037F1EF2F|nr:alcohol dehydrogenase catalytic domain-containing protein [Streptomyces sp. NBC_01176]